MSNSTFIKGLVVCVAVMLGFGGVIGLLSQRESRPEGVAEDWLTAIGDTTRKGVEADATRRADEIGPPEFGTKILHPHAEEIDRKAGFTALEVGKAVRVDDTNPDRVRVGFSVTARRPLDKSVDLSGVLTLARVDDAWTIEALNVGPDAATDVPALPSDGGPPPSSAPLTLWLGALVGAAAIGALCSALVQRAGRATAVAV